MTAGSAFKPDLRMWDPWSPEEAALRLADLSAPWYVTAGWAIDLFLGGQRRPHEDIEVSVPRERLHEVVDVLAGFELFAVGIPVEGLVTPLEEAGDDLAAFHQTWVREPATGLWRLDVFTEPSEGDTWICRRDERIRLPYDELVERTSDGIPFASPEVVLLFKAKSAREKDDADFFAVLPQLGAERRRWLSDALALVHPGHRWLAELR
jgi:hypothetical protein